VLRLVKDAKASAAAGRVGRAVVAATEARRAIDGELLKNVAMMVRCVCVVHLRVWTAMR